MHFEELKEGVWPTHGQIRREPQPCQIRHQSPRRHFVHLAPDVGQVAGHAGQEDDVGGGFDGPLELEEEWHPDQVQAELDRVEGCALLFGSNEGEMFSWVVLGQDVEGGGSWKGVFTLVSSIVLGLKELVPVVQAR